MKRKVYTVEQANATLPLVRRIVDDIVRHYERLQEHIRLSQAASMSTYGTAPREEAEHHQRRAQAIAEEIEGFVSELSSLGIEFKGFELGLVDFPGEIDGRPVCLCWKLGEPSVQFWHEVDAGYAGRRPLAPQPAH